MAREEFAQDLKEAVRQRWLVFLGQMRSWPGATGPGGSHLALPSALQPGLGLPGRLTCSLLRLASWYLPGTLSSLVTM